MNKIILSLATATALFLGTQMSSAQVKLPPASSVQTVTQSLGIKNIVLSYQRPNVNNRQIFGALVPYGEVWRTGANTIPNLTLEEEVTIEGQTVPAGTYGLFTIPNKNEWTIILSKNPKQWGAYEYKKGEDFLRFNVKTENLAKKVETFTIAFEDATPKSTQVTLAWENTKVGFKITTDQSKEIIANIEKGMLGENKPYLPAAQYYLNNNLDLKKAVEWISKADEGNTSAPHIKYWKSKILAKAGDKDGAKQAAQEGIKMATEKNNPEYIKLNTEALNAIK